jgi:hypothetical protein
MSQPLGKTTLAAPVTRTARLALGVAEPPIQPEQLWTLLTSGQQQAAFRTLVLLCRSLVSTPSPDHGREVHDE